MNPHDEKYAAALSRMIGIINDLRAQCPWDKKQTLASLRHLTIEETYELSDAILRNDLGEIKKELGDLLMHIVFYAKIASEQSAFDIADIMHGVCDKLVARHPHVYGDVDINDEAQIKRNWERIKLQEKDGNDGVLSGVPASLPALIKALRIQEKVHAVGFDWENKEQLWEKVREEIEEFREHFTDGEAQPHAPEEAENEFGDLLFTLVNYARFTGINPENALEKSNQRFMQRFNHLEQSAQQGGKQVHELNAAELDAGWEAAKRAEKLRP